MRRSSENSWPPGLQVNFHPINAASLTMTNALYPALRHQKVLVTGGGGFIGAELSQRLLELGAEVAVFGRRRYPRLKKQGITCIQGDIRDAAAVLQAAKGKTCLFHVAAKAGIWGSRTEYMGINYQGTEHVLSACTKQKIPVLVYTSTPSVVFNKKDLRGADEKSPYASRPLCAYAESKIKAEQAVLAATSPELRTAAIRPHLVWGPYDTNLIPRLISRGQARQLAIIGTGENFVDITYIDNVVHAHLLAAQNLLTSATASGEAFFIGQEEPVCLWDWINKLFSLLDIPPVIRKIPLSLAYAFGTGSEAIYWALQKTEEPKMTRFLALQLAQSHWFSHEKAKRVLNYSPQVQTDTGLARLVSWLKTSPPQQ